MTIVKESYIKQSSMRFICFIRTSSSPQFSLFDRTTGQTTVLSIHSNTFRYRLDPIPQHAWTTLPFDQPAKSCLWNSVCIDLARSRHSKPADQEICAYSNNSFISRESTMHYSRQAETKANATAGSHQDRARQSDWRCELCRCESSQAIAIK